MLYAHKLIVSRAEPRLLSRSRLPPHLGTNSSRLGTIWGFSEQTVKPLPYRERSPKPSGREKGLETSAVQRKRCENTPDLCRVWAKVDLKRRGHNNDTICIPIGVLERQKGPSEPSDYLGLRVSRSLTRHRLDQSLIKAISCEK